MAGSARTPGETSNHVAGSSADGRRFGPADIGHRSDMSHDPHPPTDRVSSALWVGIAAGIFAIAFLSVLLAVG
ncbi:hypothetical protein SAMN04489835_5362 [Mycolicibacterium rutilum]|uniref:Uncharacterized protein n=1 Tax=Mycolicibacterium rutilum TaxID=370526 RepID=A0A1H6LUX6_MYCRU|nr:hypothetical protein SAMN04489835_5362 [Mycolicibacterium rutilum]